MTFLHAPLPTSLVIFQLFLIIDCVYNFLPGYSRGNKLSLAQLRPSFLNYPTTTSSLRVVLSYHQKTRKQHASTFNILSGFHTVVPFRWQVFLWTTSAPFFSFLTRGILCHKSGQRVFRWIRIQEKRDLMCTYHRGIWQDAGKKKKFVSFEKWSQKVYFPFFLSVADRNIQLPEIVINNFPKKRGFYQSNS